MKSLFAPKNVICTLLISTFILAMTLRPAYSQDPSLVCQPLSETVDLGETLIVNITVSDIVDLVTWQVTIDFDSSLLNCTNAWYPSDHVFAGMSTVPVAPEINNELGSVKHGCCLIAVGSEFNGSGTLCQIEFEGLSEGEANLVFAMPYGEDTFLWDSNDEEIVVTIIDGSVTVIPEFSPLILVSSLIVLALVAVVLAKKKGGRKPKYQTIINN